MSNAAWDYGDVYDGPWYVFREPRDEHRLAVKSGHFTIFTVSDYFDGGGPLEGRLEFVCEVVNEKIGPRADTSSEAGSLPDTQEGRREGRDAAKVLRFVRLLALARRMFPTYSWWTRYRWVKETMRDA